MLILDLEGTFAKLDKLRVRMTRLEKNPDSNEWQYTRLLIRALTEEVAKSKKGPTRATRGVYVGAPAQVRDDWEELVDVLRKKGIKPERQRQGE